MNVFIAVLLFFDNTATPPQTPLTVIYNPVPDMTYNVFGGTLNLTQSINQSIMLLITVNTEG